MPKVSIIVPVYNVKQYLDACIESIRAQTLDSLEVICVDDGSTDGSSRILDEYLEKDSRIKVIHKENRGYGHSINTGMGAASGEYIGIVESDDCIRPDMYEKLYSAAKEHDLDLVKSDVVFWWENLQYSCEYHRDDLGACYEKVLDESYRNIFFQFFMNTWTGIYKRSFLDKNGIRHNETPGASYQDNGFWIQTLSLCERAMWLKDALYMYRQDNPAASVKSRGKLMVMVDEYDFAEKCLRMKNKKYELLICLYYRMLRHKGVFLRIADELKREYCDVIISDFRKYKELTYGNRELYEMLNRIYTDPDGFCDVFIKRKRETLQQLNNAKWIIIYGAGRMGQRAMRILACQGMQERIKCFAVSALGASEKVGVFPVRCIEELTEYRDCAVVVVGVADHSAAYHQIQERLGGLGFSNTVDLSRLTDYFYYLY